MLTSAKSIFRRLAREASGSEIAEAAAVLPLMFMMILAIFWFGQAFSIYGTITRAAQDGARAGATPRCTTCSGATATPAQNAVNAVQAALVVAKLDVSRAQYPSSLPAVNSCGVGGGGGVGCDGSASANVCVQSPIQLSPTVGGATGVCGIAVSFQYPFRFTLPFASINNQQIWLTATARVRLENQ
jgi:Flp pilus assembly protein TadG